MAEALFWRWLRREEAAAARATAPAAPTTLAALLEILEVAGPDTAPTGSATAAQGATVECTLPGVTTKPPLAEPGVKTAAVAAAPAAAAIAALRLDLLTGICFKASVLNAPVWLA